LIAAGYEILLLQRQRKVRRLLSLPLRLAEHDNGFLNLTLIPTDL
jgi:hypothetical protein